MKKIPSVFKIDWTDHKRGQVLDEVNPGCEWVLEGSGYPTRKWDGTACLIQDGVLYKRYDRKKDKNTDEYKQAPEGWFPAQDPDPITGHWTGWMPIGPNDKWHQEVLPLVQQLPDGTYELVGPKINGNPEHICMHVLIQHGNMYYDVSDRSREGLKKFLEENEIEGLVFHHPDGRMAKIKRKDFGIPWPVKEKELE